MSKDAMPPGGRGSLPGGKKGDDRLPIGMQEPEVLKTEAYLPWSRGRGVDVWAMLVAAMKGDLETISSLEARDPALLNCEPEYLTPLHFAIPWAGRRGSGNRRWRSFCFPRAPISGPGEVDKRWTWPEAWAYRTGHKGLIELLGEDG